MMICPIRKRSLLLTFFVGISTYASLGASAVIAADKQDTLVSYREFKVPYGPTKVYRSIRVTDPKDQEKTITVDQVLVRGEGSKLTFVPGEQPPEANQYREEKCEQQGGTDATNDARVEINDNVLDFALCRGPMQRGYPNVNEYPKIGMNAADSYGITIVAGYYKAVLLQPYTFPIAVWISTPTGGNGQIIVTSGAFGYVSANLYVYPGVNSFTPYFTVKPTQLGVNVINATACAPGVGCQRDDRGRFETVRSL